MSEKTATDRRGDVIARAIQGERDEWQRRADDLWISRQMPQSGYHPNSYENQSVPDMMVRAITSLFVMYVACGDDPLKLLNMFVGDQEHTLRLALARRIAEYQAEADRIVVARAVMLAEEKVRQ